MQCTCLRVVICVVPIGEGKQVALLHLIQPFDTLVEKPKAAEAAHQANEKTN